MGLFGDEETSEGIELALFTFRYIGIILIDLCLFYHIKMTQPLLNMFPGVAVVTGAGGTGRASSRNIIIRHSYNAGIGAATARAFAAAGCTKIAITDLNEKSLQQTAEAVTSKYPKVQLLVQAGNVADDQFADSFINAVVQEFGRVDYAVNCAGVLGKPLRSAEMSLEEFDRVNNINYRGCWLSSRAELRQMVIQSGLPSHDSNRPPQRGAVVNVSSQLGIVSRPGARK